MTMHRKRHVPPGPCGIWWQAHQASTKKRKSQKKRRRDSNIHHDVPVSSSRPPPASNEEDAFSSSTIPFESSRLGTLHQNPANIDSTQSSDNNHNDNNNSNKTVVNEVNMGLSSAWASMQQELNIVTPYLLPWIPEERRYEVLREKTPSHYIMLREIHEGRHDFTMVSGSLLVLVNSVESSIHHNIWTVDLRDESGASIRAWMEPKFIQSQIQSSTSEEASMVRPGVVWMLENVSMILVPPSSPSLSPSSSSFAGEGLERMLLISSKNIVRMWTPTNEQHAESNDSQEEQERVVELIEQRAFLTQVHLEREQALRGDFSDGSPPEYFDTEHCEDGINVSTTTLNRGIFGSDSGKSLENDHIDVSRLLAGVSTEVTNDNVSAGITSDPDNAKHSNHRQQQQTQHGRASHRSLEERHADKDSDAPNHGSEPCHSEQGDSQIERSTSSQYHRQHHIASSVSSLLTQPDPSRSPSEKIATQKKKRKKKEKRGKTEAYTPLSPRLSFATSSIGKYLANNQDTISNSSAIWHVIDASLMDMLIEEEEEEASVVEPKEEMTTTEKHHQEEDSVSRMSQNQSQDSICFNEESTTDNCPRSIFDPSSWSGIDVFDASSMDVELVW
jgi:hypothetical protein